MTSETPSSGSNGATVGASSADMANTGGNGINTTTVNNTATASLSTLPVQASTLPSTSTSATDATASPLQTAAPSTQSSSVDSAVVSNASSSRSSIAASAPSTTSAERNTAASSSATSIPGPQSATASTQASSSAPSGTISVTTSSLLPRSTVTSSISGSSTPVARAQQHASGVTSSFSPRRASANLHSYSQSTAAGAGPNSSGSASASASGSGSGNVPTRRVSQNSSAAYPSPTASALTSSMANVLASPLNASAVPSIFGFYSHEGNAGAPLPASRHAQSGNTAISRRSASAAHLTGSYSVLDALRTSGSTQSAASSPRMHTGHIAQAQSARNFGSTSNASTLAYHNAQAQLAQHLASDPSLLPSSLPIQHTFEETTTISFTWLVRDLHLLRDEVEHSPPPSEGGRSVSAGAGKSEVWTTQPIFGDGKWKLELVRTTRPAAGRDTSESELPPSSSANNGSAQPGAHEMSREHSSRQDISDPQAQQPIGGASITVLSVYLSAMVLDYNHADIEIPASIMLAIRPVRRPIGANGSLHGGWTWRRFYDFTFRREAEFFACHDLPSLSEMLQDAAISRDDSFALTVQLGLGPGNVGAKDSSLDMAGARPPFEVDGHRLVPRTVIGSLRGLLDDANSGDVRIVVRERGLLVAPAESIHDMHGESQAGHVVPFPVGSKVSFETGSAQDPDHVFVRDRFLWAHSSILKNRSEYFSTMLTSDFSEGIGETYSTGGAGGRSDTIESGRCVRTLRIPDADFVTTYWFLRYLYTEEIQFADEEDVRSTVLDEDWTRGAHLGAATADENEGLGRRMGSGTQQPMFAWTSISQLEQMIEEEEQEREREREEQVDALRLGQHELHITSTATSPFGLGGGGGGHDSTPTATSPTVALVRGREAGSGIVAGSGRYGTTASTSGSIRARTSGASLTGGSSMPSSPSAASSSTVTAAHNQYDDAYRSKSQTHRQQQQQQQQQQQDQQHQHQHQHQHQQQQQQHTTTSIASRPQGRSCGVGPVDDPHVHPTREPGKASALSIFRLAHRYHMQDLSRLASLHLISTLTPQTCFPLLLATSMYTELHTRVKTYVYTHWHLVANTQEFERCCDEVSTGMWGSDAGKTLRAFVRSLVSPLRPPGV